METAKKTGDIDPEIAAISAVHSALESLDESARIRVVDYVLSKLDIQCGNRPKAGEQDQDKPAAMMAVAGSNLSPPPPPEDGLGTCSGEISSVAQKWMQRNGLTEKHLSSVFSLGGEEIDVITKSVPGRTKKDRMFNVFLLKGVAEYLGSGAARVSDKEIRETCLHYDAFDGRNFAAYLKKFAPDISGTKQSGYTLTARGLVAATELIKEMVEADG